MRAPPIPPRIPARSPRQRRPVPTPRQFGAQQRIFLEKVRDDFKLLEDIARECNLNNRELTRWLTRPRFRRALNGVVLAARRRLFLELEMGRIAGARRLTTMVKDGDHQSARLSSLNLVHIGPIAFDVMRKVRAQEKEQANRPEDDSPRPRIHPDCPPDLAERLMAEADATDRAD